MKNLLRLLSSSFSAQIITFISMILIARLYSSEDFGLYAVLISILQFTPILLSFRYELTIMNSVDDDDVCINIITSIALPIGLFFIYAVFITSAYIIMSIMDIVSINSSLFLIVIMCVFFTALNEVLLKVNNFYGNYKTISKKITLNALILNFFQISLGYIFVADFYYLALGFLISTFCSFVVLILPIIGGEVFKRKNLNWELMLTAFKSNFKFSSYNVGNAFLNKSSAELPVLIISTFFGMSAVGQFSLARKIVSQPINILGSNLSLLYHKTLADIKRNRVVGAVKLAKKSILNLLIISLIISIFLVLFAEYLIAYFYGENWGLATELLILLLPLIALRLISTPIFHVFNITKKSGEFFIINLAKIFLALLGLLIGVYFEDIKITVFMYALLSSIAYIIGIIRAVKLSARIDNGI